MARVVVTVTARDLTGPQLSRMRRNFNNLGQDMDRVIGNRTRENFNRLRQSINTTARDLQSLRGAIPDTEFFDLDRQIRRAQASMRRGFNRTSAATLARIADEVNRVRDGFRDLDETGQIRVTIDDSALRRADARLAAWRRDQGRNAVRIPVNPDVNSGRFRQMVTRSLTSPVRTAGRLLGGTLSDGLGQGIFNAFKGIGPLMGAALALAIAAALAVVGAALAGLLVTALGGAFVAVGAVAASQSDEIQRNWKTAVTNIKKDFAGVGDALIPGIHRAIHRLEDMSGRFAPVLKKSLDETKTATDKFIQSVLDGFESFGKASFQPIMDAWNVFAPVFGEEWDEFMDELGNSFGRMADLVREHPTEIAAALDLVFEAVDLLVDTVTFLGKTWVFMAQTAGDVLGGVLVAVKFVTDGVLALIQGVVDGLATAFGKIPGLGDNLKEASRDFSQFREDTSAKLQALADDAFSWDDALNKANRKRTLEANISTWNDQIDAAKKKLESVPKSKQAKVKADIADLRDKVQRAKDELASIRNKFVSVNVTTYYHAVNSGQTSNRTSSQMGRRVGGNIGAAATGGVRSNMTLVGEDGPEVVDLAPGSHVRSNPDTRRMAAGGGQAPVVLEIRSGGTRMDDLLIEVLRHAVKAKGGNVQVAVMGKAA